MEAALGSSDREVTSRWAPSSVPPLSILQFVSLCFLWRSMRQAAHRDVLIALSFSNSISAELPSFFTRTSFPQNEKKSWSFSSDVSGARPVTRITWPVDIVVVCSEWTVVSDSCGSR